MPVLSDNGNRETNDNRYQINGQGVISTTTVTLAFNPPGFVRIKKQRDKSRCFVICLILL
ncbi:hypothetical protein QU24_07065 [Pantoea rodasii]|uniref:Uncharacterized protein n=2 Tax=Pantoea TaxID=53335 RepID=A0A0U3UIA3_9GAMM|nr:hypothetical protein LK04_15990 [Pantoea vagans]KHJ68893.1 hypothetical protein QU24_07065 [Pantoea rodasii]